MQEKMIFFQLLVFKTNGLINKELRYKAIGWFRIFLLYFSNIEKKIITDKQIKESDLAETLVQAENNFYQRRKKLIKNKLKEAGLNQNDLAKILGHRKGYMSELINGFRPFSKEDLIVINRLFKIKLDDLIPTFIKQDRASHIKKTLESLTNSRIRLTKRDFDLQMA